MAALTPSAGDEATRTEAPEVPPTPPTHQELEDRPPSSAPEAPEVLACTRECESCSA